MAAKPIRLRQVDADEYDGLPQRELLVVGDMPGGGEAVDVAWADVTGKPSTFPPATHTHVVADVTGLQDALDGKQASGSYAAATHTHVVADVTGLQAIINDLTSRIEALEAAE